MVSTTIILPVSVYSALDNPALSTALTIKFPLSCSNFSCPSFSASSFGNFKSIVPW